MTLPAPTVVYRSRIYQDAESVTVYLRKLGINARLVSPKEIGHVGEGPVFDVLHDVLAADCNEDDIVRLIAQWRTKHDATIRSDLSFCYHCGEMVGSQALICPSCGKPLDEEASKPLHNGG